MMCQTQSIRQPQHLIRNHLKEQVISDVIDTTEVATTVDGSCKIYDSRNTSEEMIASCDSCSIDHSCQARTEISMTFDGRSSISSNFGEGRLKKASNEDIEDRSLSLSQKMVPSMSFSSVIDFCNDDERKCVRWPQPSVVTDIRYRPRVTKAEKEALFYTEKDIMR